MQSIGERLEEARKRKGVSIREAAEATKIRGDYLQKFENNQYDIKLPEIYVRGFLRTYATYLKLPGEKLVADYNGLGLSEAKPRQLNREFYGRMDISVVTAKEEEAAAAKAQRPASAAVAEPVDKGDARNPATFVPTGGNGIDPSLLWRIGAIALGAVVVLVGGLWLIFGRSSAPAPASRPAVAQTPAAPAEIYQRPQAGEKTITLIAKGEVRVTVELTSAGLTLYQGALTTGERRQIPWRGALRVRAEPHANLAFEIGGKEYPMPNQPAADIKAP